MDHLRYLRAFEFDLVFKSIAREQAFIVKCGGQRPTLLHNDLARHMCRCCLQDREVPVQKATF